MTEILTLQYGNETIAYELSFDGRATLAISVHPDLRVTVEAPTGTPLEEIEARLLKRAAWILRRQRQYHTYLPHLPPRQYVSGESHRYLGRQYRLKVLAQEPESVSLDRTYLYVRLPDPANRPHVRQLLDAWYLDRARLVFAERVAACFPKLHHTGIAFPALVIRPMSSRWGSASPAGAITLNVKLIQVPRACIDYVVFHELCHLIEPNHSPAYYRLLDRVLPDWRDRRSRLNAFEFA